MELNFSLYFPNFKLDDNDLYTVSYSSEVYHTYQTLQGYELESTTLLSYVREALQNGEFRVAIYFASLHYFKHHGVKEFSENRNSVSMTFITKDGVDMLGYQITSYQGDCKGFSTYMTKVIEKAWKNAEKNLVE